MAKIDVVNAFAVDGEEDESLRWCQYARSRSERWCLPKKIQAMMACAKKTCEFLILPMVMRSSWVSPPPPLA